MSKVEQRAIAAVERAHMAVRRNPSQIVTLEEAAAQAGYSASRLHAIFSDRYGETFGALVRRVRLEHACRLMRARRHWSLTRIAYQSGYSESSDFTRSFRRAYGLAPSRWDRVAPLNGARKNEKNRQADTIAACDTVLMQAAPDTNAPTWPVRIEARPAQHVAVYPVAEAEQTGRLREGWDQFEAWLSTRGQMRTDRLMMGLSYDSPYDTPGSVYRFELAYPVDPNTKAGAGVVIRDLPATQAAVLSCNGDLEVFSGAWDYLCRIFVPNSPWEPGLGPTLETYFDDPRPSGMTLWNMDCIVPVQRSGGAE
ncbi:hypothetical protein GCM10007853_07080 [Algimonas ampicilliniresistens]|uniref:HTH araC/xylS-type domain-containing protein n=1 Tax=Algimonas ampicilliniresistens TaxID=1298735 RepID=A0ABQ5V5M2_9PROT|nr:AraC family transcriptional regulator [Algimonas ampicilliniresistens]GLQ22834.1 hypothetical protein GCM10007853_07080 [Algimonas ampicilliniresistens]